jgi:hypothetical protein
MSAVDDITIPGSLVVGLVGVWGVVSAIVAGLFSQVIRGYEARLIEQRREMEARITDLKRDNAATEVEREWLLGLAVRGTDLTDRALSLAETKARARAES